MVNTRCMNQNYLDRILVSESGTIVTVMGEHLVTE